MWGKSQGIELYFALFRKPSANSVNLIALQGQRQCEGGTVYYNSYKQDLYQGGFICWGKPPTFFCVLFALISVCIVHCPHLQIGKYHPMGLIITSSDLKLELETLVASVLTLSCFTSAEKKIWVDKSEYVKPSFQICFASAHRKSCALNSKQNMKPQCVRENKTSKFARTLGK